MATSPFFSFFLGGSAFLSGFGALSKSNVIKENAGARVSADFLTDGDDCI